MIPDETTMLMVLTAIVWAAFMVLVVRAIARKASAWRRSRERPASDLRRSECHSIVLTNTGETNLHVILRGDGDADGEPVDLPPGYQLTAEPDGQWVIEEIEPPETKRPSHSVDPSNLWWLTADFPAPLRSLTARETPQAGPAPSKARLCGMANTLDKPHETATCPRCGGPCRAY